MPNKFAREPRIRARSLLLSPSERLFDVIYASEILYGFNVHAVERQLFRSTSQQGHAYKGRAVYIRTKLATYRTDFRAIDDIVDFLGGDFIRANHGLFVNHTKVRWFELPLAGFTRDGECENRSDEYIVLSRIQGVKLFDLINQPGAPLH